MDRSRIAYLLLLFLTALWCAGIIAAPLLRSSGVGLSTLLYHAFSEVCHQLPDRSFTMFGEPFGVCMRCSAIYFAFLAGLIAYPFLATRFHDAPPVPWILAVALLPMGLDVALNVLGFHASTAWTRTASGLIAGVILPFYLLPILREAVQQLLPTNRGSIHAAKTE
ncbi:MAG: DUF2085 domain-containing protein [Ignavibacterium sp.]|jgi:uncharacterized membrane protein